MKADYQANLTTVTIVPDRAAMARYGIEAQQVMDVVEALGGREVGIIFEGRARFPIRVRIPDEWRSEIDRLKQLPVAEAGGKPVPLTNWPRFALKKRRRASNMNPIVVVHLFPPTCEDATLRRL